MNSKAKQAIGIFDSGVGGLTVASAIKNLLPSEKMIYFGDTAHLPYGDKSSDSIKYYSKKITEFLLEQNCKIIVIACNSASSNAYLTVKELVGDRAIVINVIDPVIDFVLQNKQLSKIGVIGTKSTIDSGTYQRNIKSQNSDIELVPLSTPLFAPMIEEGFIFDDISNAIIRSYLSFEKFNNIDSLILGCTHYPIIRNQIRKFFNFNVEVIDSANVVARYLQDLLIAKNLLNSLQNPQHKFYVSDYTLYFKKIAEMFFDGEVILSKLNFWK
ncbi:MAG: glutamate racemase [Bacteroidetes bacterium]|jgi:glutamate racemase|nr:glutamate racemase [Bacteroidota bacterium]MBT6686321.1 glutamate racemase [Bacteroidota bacterium]MBT7142154.1 glutamate racemase [Bacteroidota bacterium]MBT7490491.1 glutamate racemase [Bacteroidota bacterium]